MCHGKIVDDLYLGFSLRQLEYPLKIQRTTLSCFKFESYFMQLSINLEI